MPSSRSALFGDAEFCRIVLEGRYIINNLEKATRPDPPTFPQVGDPLPIGLTLTQIAWRPQFGIAVAYRYKHKHLRMTLPGLFVCGHVPSTPPAGHGAHPDDFHSRCPKISSHSPRLGSSSHGNGAISKLYNPGTDGLPLQRTAELEQLSDVTGSSYPHGSRSRGAPQYREEARDNSSTVAKTTPSDFLFSPPMAHLLPTAPSSPQTIWRPHVSIFCIVVCTLNIVINIHPLIYDRRIVGLLCSI
ncbi:hypothetical protein FA13DRAFT_1804549 [Coprinellus micaceus]|uniref:Uncharacterized protein n=1 Tax=Coprinellus micaceus TaxID=71717 RepID=A0A4Y7S5Y0_COPMI|nr:hypothetical protein FA13DRAFT_1804549 [Coprinellus micaceus]